MFSIYATTSSNPTYVTYTMLPGCLKEFSSQSCGKRKIPILKIIKLGVFTWLKKMQKGYLFKNHMNFLCSSQKKKLIKRIRWKQIQYILNYLSGFSFPKSLSVQHPSWHKLNVFSRQKVTFFCLFTFDFRVWVKFKYCYKDAINKHYWKTKPFFPLLIALFNKLDHTFSVEECFLLHLSVILHD